MSIRSSQKSSSNKSISEEKGSFNEYRRLIAIVAKQHAGDQCPTCEVQMKLLRTTQSRLLCENPKFDIKAPREIRRVKSVEQYNYAVRDVKVANLPLEIYNVQHQQKQLSKVVNFCIAASNNKKRCIYWIKSGNEKAYKIVGSCYFVGAYKIMGAL